MTVYDALLTEDISCDSNFINLLDNPEFKNKKRKAFLIALMGPVSLVLRRLNLY